MPPAGEGIVRSISTGRFAGSTLTKAEIRSGGYSELEDGRADFGASVTGEARPLEKKDCSSGDMRRPAEERSSLCGKGGRCKDDSDMAEGRLPSGMEEVGRARICVRSAVGGSTDEASEPSVGR